MKYLLILGMALSLSSCLKYGLEDNLPKFKDALITEVFICLLYTSTLKNPNTTSYHQIGFLQTAYLSAGLYQNSTDIMNSPRRMASIVAPGDIIYRDVNGDGKIDGDDFRRVGKSAFPRVTYGFTADLTYGGWFMNMLWQGSGKRSIYLGDVIQSNYSTNIRYEFQTKNHWEQGASNSQFPRLKMCIRERLWNKNEH